MMALRRLDAELVRRKLAKSREEAKALIESESVKVAGVLATKPTRQVETSVAITVTSPAEKYVSRGAYKLLGVLNQFEPFGLSLADRIVLDAGASTGGFTQVSLEKGAALVHAVDVGYGQIAWSLRTDARVNVVERFNVRNLKPTDLSPQPDFVVADLSFISLTTVLPSIANSVSPNADFLLMVKPQFEVGRADIGNGVVTDPALRTAAVKQVSAAADDLNLNTVGVGASPLPGPSGNVEYFVWLKRGGSPVYGGELADEISRVVQEGPQ